MGAHPLILPIRAAQGLIALVNTILLSYTAHRWRNGYAYGNSPSEVNFLLFTSVWTLLAVTFLVIAPARFPDAAHKYAVLGVEGLTNLFWFAGWISLASLMGDVGVGRWTPGQTAVAATVLGAFEWLLFTFTFFLAASYAWRTRREHHSKHDPTVRIDAAA